MTEKMYNQCVNLYADKVNRFIWKNLRHEEDAKDIVQSAFEKLCINRAQVAEGKEKSYLFTIAYHQMINHIRKNKRVGLHETFGDEVLGNTKQPNAIGHQNLMRALDQLNELQKSLVMLKDYEGYCYQEIGEITGLNESQVKVYLHRARITLRNYLVSPENVL
jgi:RNA polymerase sigma-70 factor (ECF subfamily)